MRQLYEANAVRRGQMYVWISGAHGVMARAQKFSTAPILGTSRKIYMQSTVRARILCLAAIASNFQALAANLLPANVFGQQPKNSRDPESPAARHVLIQISDSSSRQTLQIPSRRSPLSYRQTL